ncbi:hypothetical protein [Cognatiyoonia sp. IB215182]|uniref:hypothetical protein n=1 Tax=Cognatiyoonia sp. IB215182 TaxID=3097353 RepID=UPI002A10646F|nr:hypothetical protein [Cognatiyoonia sp. IB215182]MDX8351275.1 hypothetical protein [Cognatiyoonia sp. IB215182]
MPEGSRVLPALRIWFCIEVLFASFGLVSVAYDPANSASNFAWSIQPPVTAAMIGGFYLAIAPILILGIFARSWERVRVVVIPALVFTAMLLVATWLHWASFRHGTPAFWLWYVSYFTPPFAFGILYLLQWRRQQAVPNHQPMIVAFRSLLILLGLLITAEGLYTFVNPAHFMAPQAFVITPLTARTIAGWMTAVGLILLFSAAEGAFERVRIGAPFLILALPCLWLQMARFPDQVDWTHPRLLAMGAVLALCTIVGLYMVRGLRLRN